MRMNKEIVFTWVELNIICETFRQMIMTDTRNIFFDTVFLTHSYVEWHKRVSIPLAGR